MKPISNSLSKTTMKMSSSSSPIRTGSRENTRHYSDVESLENQGNRSLKNKDSPLRKILSNRKLDNQKDAMLTGGQANKSRRSLKRDYPEALGSNKSKSKRTTTLSNLITDNKLSGQEAEPYAN